LILRMTLARALAMKKIGLALSGGGFRASLYHLGLVRFLRDAGILSQVSHITSVSGGSIFAAHLVLNWDRFNGSANEFDAAAAEFLAFVNLDIRNRITRRFPLNLPLRWPRRLLGRSNRKLTRTGLLEYHYEDYLYGDISLFELPERPQLHILATNLSEGCLCSFNRHGLLMVRPQPGGRLRIDRIHAGLATVAMAVTASSAFPGFFPPLELTGAEVGTSVGEFGRQAYTDGGVFDNLGVRMFRCLERPLLAESPLSRDDFLDFPAVLEALRLASQSSAETPLRRLAHILVAACHRQDLLLLPGAESAPTAALQPAAGSGLAGSLVQLPSSSAGTNGDHEALLLSSLWNVIHHYQFQLDPVFAGLKPVAPEAEATLQVSRLAGRVLDANDQLWLNRHLLEAAFRQATGQACFRRLDSGLDGVLVSDVGKPMEVQGNRRAGGLIRTAMRASDILMDRVWQLEKATFQDTPGFIFAPVTEVVDPAEDPTALHPEIQRQLPNIRTDLDRFSLLEISNLVRHGYCVGRKTCRACPKLFGTDLPGNAPWDPILGPGSKPSPASAVAHLNGTRREPAPATVEARTLQASAIRRIWSTLLDYRDWTSYVYVPLLIPIIVLLPYVLVKSYQRSHRLNQLIDSLSQGSRDLGIMSQLLDGPMKPWTGVAAEEDHHLENVDLKSFEVLQDSRIIDLRKWKPAAPAKGNTNSAVYGYRRLKVLKRPETGGNNLFRVHIMATSLSAQIRFPPQQLQPKLHRIDVESTAPGEPKSRWEMSVDFSKVPAGDFVDVTYEHYSSGEFLQEGEQSTTIAFPMQVDTAEVTRWILMPKGREYQSFRILRYQTGKPDKVEPVKVVTEYLADDHTILAYKLLSVKAGYTYELTWFYQ
jgi:predicted acylesterase/phospholipase RssA